MTCKIYTKDEWIKALGYSNNAYKIFVPVLEDDFHDFKPLDNGISPDFYYQNTRLSPKSLVYPQSEMMFEYSLDENEPDVNLLKELKKEYHKQAIVGIRPCDAHAFQIAKLNFSNSEYRDPWWIHRFESTTLVGLGCNDPCSTCFCTSVGGGPFSKDWLDVLLYDMGSAYLAKAITERGEEFLNKAEGGSRQVDDSVLKDADNLAVSASEKLTAGVRIDRLKEKTINSLFDAAFWDDVAFACLNCGICTYLCPTCWCFDIQDEVIGKKGDRIRNWDSCMFPIFTLHGSGHNPRKKKMQRVRQRFMHKFKYYVDKYKNGVQCSGCGRCIRYCPANIDVRQVCELMNDYG